MLTFHFTGVDGQMTEAETLTSGMAGKQAKLEFSPDWGGLSKTAVFMAGEVVRDAVAASDEIVIPAEICVTVNKSYITYEPYTITYEGGVSSYIVLQSPDGSQFWLSVEDDGTVTAVPVNSGGMDSEPDTAIEWKIPDRTAVTAAYASTTAARSIRFDSYLLGIADNGYWNGDAFAPSVTLSGEDFTLTAKKSGSYGVGVPYKLAGNKNNRISLDADGVFVSCETLVTGKNPAGAYSREFTAKVYAYSVLNFLAETGSDATFTNVVLENVTYNE